MDRFLKAFLMALIGLFSGVLVGCNTIEGAGEDIQDAGEGIEDAGDQD